MNAIYISISLILSPLITSSGSSAQVEPSVLDYPNPIAFSGTEKQIYLSDSEGKSQTEVSNAKGDYVAWSPDGKKLAFRTKYDDRKTWSIHTVNADGTDWRRLTHTKNKWDSAPTWSPDGAKIAFAREYENLEGVWHSEIWIMNSDGSEQHRIEALKGSNPNFAPDGRLVFSTEFNDKKSEISIADIDGSNITHLTNNEAEEWHPEVSPDGKHIAFMSNRDGNYEIYMMDIDGSNQKRLTFNNVDDWYPSWSPDNTKILYSSMEEEGMHIYIMNRDGASPKKIISNSMDAMIKR